MNARWKFLALALAVSALGGCGIVSSKPDDVKVAATALKELRAAREKMAGAYVADFAVTFREPLSPKFWAMNWTGSISSTGQAWTVSSDLTRDGAPYAHLDVVQVAAVRYHKQNGGVTLEKWRPKTGAAFGTCYWWVDAIQRSAEVTIEETRLPEVDPLVYLDIERVFRLERTGLPGGGHRYELRPNSADWLPGEGLVQALKYVRASHTELTIELDATGRLTTVGAKPVISNATWDPSITITLREIDGAVTVSPPPAEQVES
jgi:hypothetical protein